MSERKKSVHVGGGTAGVLGLNHDDAEESSRKPLHRARLFFPDEQTQGRTRKSVRPTDLILKKAKVRSGNIFRMADEERKDRWVNRDLSHERGRRNLGRLPFSGRQGMNGENFLQELIELSGWDPGRK